MLHKYYEFLFRPTDARIYSLFRMVFSMAVLFNFCNLWHNKASLFSDGGMIDHVFIAGLCEGKPYYSVFHYFHSQDAIDLVFIISGISIIFMGIGLLSRLSILIVYLWQLSYVNSIFPVLSGWDTLLTVYTFLLLISPTSDLWSMDGYIKSKFFRKKLSESAPAYGLYLMRFQLCIVYFSTVGLKLYNYYWLNGEFYAYFMLSVYSRFPDPFFAGNRILSAMLTYGTLVIELLIPILLLTKKFKRIGFLLGFSLHLSIMLSSNLFIFSFTMLTLYVPFLNRLENIPAMFRRCPPSGS